MNLGPVFEWDNFDIGKDLCTSNFPSGPQDDSGRPMNIKAKNIGCKNQKKDESIIIANGTYQTCKKET